VQQRYTERQRQRSELVTVAAKAATTTPATSETTAALHKYDDDQQITFGEAGHDNRPPNTALPLDGNHNPDATRPTLSGDVKADMKTLVMNAMNQVMDDELVWDEIVGRLVTEPKRLLFKEETTTTAKFESIEKMLNRMQQSRQSKNAGADYDEGMKDWSLVRTPGISFATSCVLGHKNQTIHRLFANGEMYETWDDQKRHDENKNYISNTSNEGNTSIITVATAAIILNRIERGQPIRLQQHVAHASKSTRELLQNLSDDGFLYLERMPLSDTI
jgi:hypothetical protein